MTRRGRKVKGQAATGAATDTNGGKAQSSRGTGADSRQPKNTAPEPAAHNGAHGTPLNIAGTHRATPSAQGVPVNNTNSQNHPPRGPRKPRGPRVDPRNLLYANNERLWDPSKGIKMTPKQSPTESQRDHRPEAFTTPVRGTNRNRALDMEDKGENIPASAGTINRFRASPPQKPLETSYVVEETYDPDSFDRGRTVQRKTSPRPNRRERRHREHQRQEEELQREHNLIRAKIHWGTANIDDFAVQEHFQEVVRNMQEEQETRMKNEQNDSENEDDEDRIFDQPIPPPSHDLLEYTANKDDKLLGRFVNYPATASGRHNHEVHALSSLLAQTANMALTEDTTTDKPVIGGQSQMEDEEEDSLDAFFMSLHRNHAITSISLGYNINFAGMGAQFS